MLDVMLWERWIDEAYIASHTEGFDALRDLVRDYSPQMAGEICGIRPADIVTHLRWVEARPGGGTTFCFTLPAA